MADIDDTAPESPRSDAEAARGAVEELRQRREEQAANPPVPEPQAEPPRKLADAV